MVYITLDELKEHLPIILSDWIEPGDEGWEWIFQEIEQKCHIGKKKNGKKKKVDIDTLTQRVQDLNKEVEEMHRGFIDTKNNVTQLGLSMKDMGAEINRLKRDIAATKSMAEIAKNRTEVNYSNYSSKISEDQIIQNVYNRMANRGATKEELEQLDFLFSKYILDVDMSNQKHQSVTSAVHKPQEDNYTSISTGYATYTAKDIRTCDYCKHNAGLPHNNGTMEYSGACKNCVAKDMWEGKEK